MYRIITTVRQAVPDHLPVTAKIRLGWDNPADCLTIADAAAAAGATELAVHARTKEDGYRSEAIKWEWIAHIRERLSIPVIANGEIWSHADGVRCRAVTGCQDLMVGRGALNVPNLGAVVQHQAAVMPWSEVLQLLMHYGELEVQGDKSVYFPSRIKQWFRYLRQQYEQAQPLFGELRSCTEPALIMALLQREIAKLQG